jgi:putative sugar O-methyltransferase
MRNLIKQVVGYLYEHSLAPMTNPENRLVNKLREDIKLLENIDFKGLEKSAKEWSNNRVELRENILKRDPRAFLKWPVIKNTMFVQNEAYIKKELVALKQSEKFENRYKNAIIESKIGHPNKYPQFTLSSANLIHHAYSMYQFENESGVDVSQLETIIEFGGGYGSMCRLFHNLGFQGKYIIFDFDEFSILQDYFLSSIGIKVFRNEKSLQENGVYCISDMNLLHDILEKASISLFVGMWSLSESPLNFREDFLTRIPDCDNYLIAYQEQFNEVDNVDYFSNWSNSKKNYDWKDLKIKHLPTNHYLFGNRKG